MAHPARTAEDPFRYGWRYVERKLSSGETTIDQVPLTLEDVLHPEFGDFIVNNTTHNRDRRYLYNVIDDRLPKNSVVLEDAQVDWQVPGLRPHGPDIAAFTDVRHIKDEWSTFCVGTEKARPLFTIEITSPATRSNDLGIKVQHYWLARVPLYIIVEARRGKSGKRLIDLIGYRRGRTKYERLDLDADGRLALDPLNVSVGSDAGRIVCYDQKSGEPIPDYREQAQRSRKAQRELRKAEERIRQLEAELTARRARK